MFIAVLPALKYFRTWCYQKRDQNGKKTTKKQGKYHAHLQHLTNLFTYSQSTASISVSYFLCIPCAQILERYHSFSFLLAVRSIKLWFYKRAEPFLQIMAKQSCRDSLDMSTPKEGSKVHEVSFALLDLKRISIIEYHHTYLFKCSFQGCGKRGFTVM